MKLFLKKNRLRNILVIVFIIILVYLLYRINSKELRTIDINTYYTSAKVESFGEFGADKFYFVRSEKASTGNESSIEILDKNDADNIKVLIKHFNGVIENVLYINDVELLFSVFNNKSGGNLYYYNFKYDNLNEIGSIGKVVKDIYKLDNSLYALSMGNSSFKFTLAEYNLSPEINVKNVNDINFGGNLNNFMFYKDYFSYSLWRREGDNDTIFKIDLINNNRSIIHTTNKRIEGYQIFNDSIFFVQRKNNILNLNINSELHSVTVKELQEKELLKDIYVDEGIIIIRIKHLLPFFSENYIIYSKNRGKAWYELDLPLTNIEAPYFYNPYESSLYFYSVMDEKLIVYNLD